MQRRHTKDFILLRALNVTISISGTEVILMKNQLYLIVIELILILKATGAIYYTLLSEHINLSLSELLCFCCNIIAFLYSI